MIFISKIHRKDFLYLLTRTPKHIKIMKNLTLIFFVLLTSCNAQQKPDPSESSTPVNYYLGSWALDLNYENNTAGWLEITQQDGYLDGELLWRWGSVTPVSFVFIGEGSLYVTRSRELIRTTDASGKPNRIHQPISWLKMDRTGENTIDGTAYFPGNDGVTFEKVTFTGKRIPPAKKPDLSAVTYSEPIYLLEENGLSGWELLNKGAPNGWSVKEGILVNDSEQKPGEEHIYYGNLRTTDTFEDFNITLEVNVPEGSNSGIYLRGIYEIQVADTYGKEPDSHNMGALYSRITPSASAEKPAGEWQTMDITLCQRHLTVILNGVKIIDNQPLKGVTGGAMTSDEFSPGPIYLQGDHGPVSYRNIVIRKIK